jgi:hypothetical protein
MSPATGFEDFDSMDEVISPESPHLGGNYTEGDPQTYCPLVWGYVIDRFSIESVLDVGSGCGHSAAWFSRKGLKTVAVEGLLSNVRNSIFPAVLHDLTAGPITMVVDLVHCQEVAEHIEEKYLDNLLKSLACGKLILMTHALPNQEGHHHVNLKPMGYWVNHVLRYGYHLLIPDTKRIRQLAQSEGAWFMAQSGLLFHRNRI